MYNYITFQTYSLCIIELGIKLASKFLVPDKSAVIICVFSTCATVLALPILDSDGVIDVFLVSVLIEARVAFLDSVRTNQPINTMMSWK